MEKIVVRIPSDLARDLVREAEELRLTKSEVVRRRLSARSGNDSSVPKGFDLIADLVGSVKNLPEDLSQKRKKYLTDTGYGR